MRRQVWEIPRRWCWTHDRPLWSTDSHHGFDSRQCHVSGRLAEIPDDRKGEETDNAGT